MRFQSPEGWFQPKNKRFDCSSRCTCQFASQSSISNIGLLVACGSLIVLRIFILILHSDLSLQVVCPGYLPCTKRGSSIAFDVLAFFFSRAKGNKGPHFGCPLSSDKNGESLTPRRHKNGRSSNTPPRVVVRLPSLRLAAHLARNTLCGGAGSFLRNCIILREKKIVLDRKGSFGGGGFAFNFQVLRAKA